MNKKKILLLGGSAQQVIAIEKAKSIGCYTVLCDYLPDNPGQHYADKFYLVSTTDLEKVLQVAIKEKIDGILAYASDPAAPTAAYVGEILGLPSNPYHSVKTLCNKDDFRSFLKENGFNAPTAKSYKSSEDVLRDMDDFSLPVIVKPVDSSGSKGVTILRAWDGISNALDFAFSYSRSHRAIVEEFIDKKHPYLIGGDIFIIDGKIVLWGLMNCHRDCEVNPLVPVGKSYPPKLDDRDLQRVKDTLQTIVNKLQIRFGSVNVELVIDKENRVWPIDIGPRAGGNMIPDLMEMIFNVDVVGMSVRAAMGQKLDMAAGKGVPFYATHNMHSKKKGSYLNITFSQVLEPFIIQKNFYKKPGDKVEYFDNAAKALGIVFLKFSSEEQMMKILNTINQHINIHLVGGGKTIP